MTLYIGIDPGLDGAVAFICGQAVKVVRTPTVKMGKRRQCDLASMVSIMRDHTEPYCQDAPFAVLESVHSMPKQGVASSFSFGRGFGMWEAILAALGVPYELVSPQAWKKVMLRDTDHSKGAAKLVASRLWPALGKLTDGEAEASLMAEYGRRLRGGS